jgi:hypothetical protein
MNSSNWPFFYGKSNDFEANSLEMWDFQYKNNPLLRSYHDQLRKYAPTFLPIHYYKSHEIKAEQYEAAKVFTSSGTTGDITSKHFVKDLRYYEASFINGFNYFYGAHQNYCFLCLLPSYLEREGSSLIYMAEYFINHSKYKQSNFYLNDLDSLSRTLKQNEKDQIPTILLGVTYALLDFAEFSPMALKHTIVMETGGMKGKRPEMVRASVHEILCAAFKTTTIHSEYGMTELLSQAYSKGNGVFACPPWMKIIIRDTNDPFTLLPYGKTGGINIIDLANRYSCAFIETQDLGKVYKDGTFEVLGRFDHSDIRGCNLLIQ